MKATVEGRVVAESGDTVEVDGYHYFPAAAVRVEWLEKAPRTDDDRQCPHGVQFYDVVIDGKRFARAAWAYERPRPAMARTAGRFGFWNEVEVG